MLKIRHDFESERHRSILDVLSLHKKLHIFSACSLRRRVCYFTSFNTFKYEIEYTTVYKMKNILRKQELFPVFSGTMWVDVQNHASFTNL